MLRKARDDWRRPTPSGAGAILYAASDLRILADTESEEEAQRLMRVVGAKGSINEGIVYDIQEVSGRGADALGGEFDDYEPLDAADDPGKSHVQVANASVRGDYAMNPAVDEVELAKLAEIDDPEAAVHANKVSVAKAKKAAKA